VAQARAGLAPKRTLSDTPKTRSEVVLRRISEDRVGLAGLALVGAFIIAVLLAPFFPLPDPLAQNMTMALKAPGVAGHVLGTDQFGRDLLSRVVWGGRLSITVGIVASLIAVGVGVPLGMASGYLGGRFDSVIMRSTDMMLAFPYILLALVVVAARGPGLINALVAVAITNIPFYLRATRGIVVTVAHQQFVDSALAMGATTGRILRTAILPAMVPYITVAFTISVGWLILEASSLSFLGLGAQPPQPEWGAMLAEARTYIAIAPHVVIIPGLAIFLLVINLNLAGDALRDALDVELKE
jgi:peptide/nickel transport system permease protein